MKQNFKGTKEVQEHIKRLSVVSRAEKGERRE